MRLTKRKKAIQLLIALSTFFCLGFVTNIVDTPLFQVQTVVYADDVKVYGEESMRTGQDVYALNPTSPDTPIGTSGIDNRVYLSKDGKTRYLNIIGQGAGWYIWKPDSKNKYGGIWESTDKNIIKQTSGGSGLAEIFEKTYGYPYTASPIELKSKFESNTSDTQNTNNNQPTTTNSNDVKDTQEVLKKYNAYLKLGDRPTSATILASAVLNGGSQTGIDRKKVSYSELSQYPYVENVNTNVGGKEVNVEVYEYGNLKQGVGSTTEGATTANVIKVLNRYGWLSTSNKNETKANWYDNLKENINNPVYAIGTILATIGGVIADFAVGIFDSLISGLGTVVGWLLPIKIFGFATENLQGLSQVDNWFTRVVKKMIEIIFGSDLKGLFYRILGLSISIGIVQSAVLFLQTAKREGLKGGILSFKNIIYKIMIWTLGVTVIAGLYQFINNEKKISGAPARDALKSETSFNTEYFAVATNLDPSIIYPETFNLLNTNKLLTNEELDTNFKPTGKTVSEANSKIEAILGSELIAQIDEKNDDDNGILSGVVNNKTWNVNDYLSGIETAGQPLVTQDGGFALNTGITANRLPNGLSWNNSVLSNTTVSVTPSQLANNAVQDELKQGWFMFKGTPIWFDAITDDTNAKSEESSYVSSGGWVGIKYSPSIYNPQKVSQTDTHTYLYGATQNNNAMTLNVSNYTFMTGMTTTSDFLSYPKKGNKIEESTDVRKTDKPINGTISKDISDKLEKTEKPVKSDNLQWRNGYMIAMYNKYAGTNQTSQKGYATAGNMGFSNQSTMILLQSTYKKDGLTYIGYNTPNSKTDASKAQTQDNVYMPIYSTIGSGSALSSALSRTSYGLIANAIIMYGITVSIFQFGLGVVIKDAWTYFGRWLKRASATGLFMVVVNTIYYYIIFTISDLVADIVLKTVSLTITELQTDGNLGTANTFVIGLVLLALALSVTLRLIQLNGRKVSFSSLFFYAITIGYDNIKEFAEKVDVALYGEQVGKTKTEPSKLDDEVSRRMKIGYGKGSGLVRTALGSFIGNSVADKFDDSSRSKNILPPIGQGGAGGEGTIAQGSESRYSLPILGQVNQPTGELSGNTISRELNSTRGFGSGIGRGIGAVGKNAIKGNMSKKLLTHGAVGALGFTPLGWAGTSYMAMRGAVKASKGIKRGYSMLKGSELGTRMGMNGRAEQLKNRYGLKSNDELSAHITSGKIKPRRGEGNHFKKFVDNNNWINSLDKHSSVSPEIKQRLSKMNNLSGKAPSIGGLRQNLQKQLTTEKYVKNDNIKINNSTKAIVLAKKFADGQLLNHTRGTIPQRREAYLREQSKSL